MSVVEPTETVDTLEIRILEGPNLYFTRPAIKLVLAVPGLLHATPEQVVGICREAGLRRVAPTVVGSDARQRQLLRLAERVVRGLAAEVGVRRVGVRVRAGNAREEIVVAAVWRHRRRAEALMAAVAPVLRGLLEGAAWDSIVGGHLSTVREAPRGEPARVLTPRIPVAAITGTNGKTTTTRLLAHLAMTAGLRTAWSSTDGIVVQGEVVEPGDYSGPAGARGVLSAPGVEIGILETARGGMLLKGVGVTHNDVSVVTNVSADHLGQQGIDTVDQLAEVKAIITHVTQPSGWCVLNGDDPRVWAMRTGTKARPWVFTADPDAPAIREALSADGRAITVIDEAITVITPSGSEPLVAVPDVPMALGGLSRHNIANALAGAAAGLALGLPRAAVIDGLRTFVPDARLNPGRMNVYSCPVEGGSVTVIVDLAHNEAGLDALLDVAHGLVAPGAKVALGLGTAGDRTDEILQALGEIAGRRADQVVLAHKEHYLRGRSIAEMEAPLLAGLAVSGVAHAESTATEVEGLEMLVAAASPGDVVALMCHAERAEITAWLEAHRARPDGADAIRRKVRSARGEHPAQAEIDALWEIEDESERIARAAQLHAAAPGDPVVTYEYAGTFDSAGREDEAAGLYAQALAEGLREPLRHRCLLQLASTLRNLGRHDEAGARIDEAAATEPASIGVAMFRALIHHDGGRADQALADLLALLAVESTDADVARYRRSLTAYAAELASRR